MTQPPEKIELDLANSSAMDTAFYIKNEARFFNVNTQGNKGCPKWFKGYAIRIASCTEDLLNLLGNARYDDALDKLDELRDLGAALNTEQKKRSPKKTWANLLNRLGEDLQILGDKITCAKAVEKRITT
uniref:Uncharacterized protein n=1 Tax=Candidatus Kentrum sp. UNK TaxID=2126344 RepID=A0A451ASV8_9GAMM|nr:MAG: hypothetical protein BECKUNK1418G_GA0071005_13132 [Candidatus Kentron sp. UNK]VFK73775.1 MAG: hypothetical protein BECKUNK1418H_GA0071006_12862 [Candidatus Kentron sp. UNK]